MRTYARRGRLCGPLRQERHARFVMVAGMRTFVMGDPQAPFAKVMEVLARHGALQADRLAPDVVLVSIGDHFDYDHRDSKTSGQEGLRILRWLTSHDASQVVLLLGNHDVSRVMELVSMTDERFAEARSLAQAVDSACAMRGRPKCACRSRSNRCMSPGSQAKKVAGSSITDRPTRHGRARTPCGSSRWSDRAGSIRARCRPGSRRWWATTVMRSACSSSAPG